MQTPNLRMTRACSACSSVKFLVLGDLTDTVVALGAAFLFPFPATRDIFVQSVRYQLTSKPRSGNAKNCWSREIQAEGREKSTDREPSADIAGKRSPLSEPRRATLGEGSVKGR